MSVQPSVGPVQTALAHALRAALEPQHLEIVDESYKHASGPGAESHFKVFIVSAAFEGVSVLQRHRLVMDAARGGSAELPCHALSVSAKTPAQWAAGATLHATPACASGGKA